MLSDQPHDPESSARGRNTPLYRQRRAHLTLLAELLDEAGCNGVVTEPDGMPVLDLRRCGVREAAIVATVGHGDVDWFRWMNNDYIAPCAEPLTAATEVQRALNSQPMPRSR